MRRSLAAVSSRALMISLGMTAGAHAQTQTGDGAIALDPVTVTATRAERPVSAIPGSVQVIGPADIREQQAISNDAAALVAKLVPGFSVPNQTISGASMTFRGRSVLIMVDGVPRNTPLRDVSRTLSLIDLNTIERIEILNGASSLNGTGGTGGTINFVTRKADSAEPSVTVGTTLRAFTANAGRSLAPEVTASVSQKLGAVDYLFSGTGRKQRRTYGGDGAELPSDGMLGQGGGDRYESLDLFGRVGVDFGSRRFEITGEWQYLDQKPDWFTDYSASPARPDRSSPYYGESLQEDSKYLTARFVERDFALGSVEVKGFYNDIAKRSPYTRFDAVVNNQVYYSGDPSSPAADFAQGTLYSKRAGLNVTVDTPLDAVRQGMRLSWGADYTFDDTSQKLTNGWHIISPMKQHGVAAFAQLDVPVDDRLTLRGGARYERFFLNVADYERPAIYYINRVFPAIDVEGGSFDYGAVTFNLGATYAVTRNVQLFGGFSQGFSLTDVGGFTRRAGANSSAELCDAYGNLVCPGAGLPDYMVSYANFAPKPQIVDNYEIGLRGKWSNFGGSVSAFLSKSDEGVNYDVASNRVSQQKERIWGFEGTGWWRVTPALTLGTVLSYREGRYDKDGDGEIDSWLPNNRIATPWRGLVYGTWVFGNGAAIRPELEFFTGRDRAGVSPEIEGAALVNLLATYPLGPGELTFGIQNLFDTDYVNPTATATRGIAINGFGRLVSVGYKATF
ncbi:ligand-gated channel protein [Allostella sp. ATCC 35155]|nr:ligand-gated channel protein [Stella sp. ATCC 35155]